MIEAFLILTLGAVVFGLSIAFYVMIFCIHKNTERIVLKMIEQNVLITDLSLKETKIEKNTLEMALGFAAFLKKIKKIKGN